MPIKPFRNYSGPVEPVDPPDPGYVVVTRKLNKYQAKLIEIQHKRGRMACDALEHFSPAGCPNPACRKYVEPVQRQKNLWAIEDEDEERVRLGLPKLKRSPLNKKIKQKGVK